MPYYGCVERTGSSAGGVCCTYVTTMRPNDSVMCAGEFDTEDEARTAAKGLWRYHRNKAIDKLNAEYDAKQIRGEKLRAEIEALQRPR